MYILNSKITRCCCSDNSTSATIHHSLFQRMNLDYKKKNTKRLWWHIITSTITASSKCRGIDWQENETVEWLIYTQIIDEMHPMRDNYFKVMFFVTSLDKTLSRNDWEWQFNVLFNTYFDIFCCATFQHSINKENDPQKFAH